MAASRAASPVTGESPALRFALAAAGIYALGAVLVRALPGYPHPERVAAAIAFDLTFTVTFFAWFFPVRRGVWPPASVAAVFLLSALAARRLVPAEGDGFFTGLRWLTAPLELALLAWILVRAVRARRAPRQTADLDLHARIRKTARELFWNRVVAEAIAFEIAVLAYACGPRRAPHAPRGATAFTYHRKIGYGAVVGAMAMVVLAETFPVHVLLARWRPGVAWTVTALGLYTLFYLLADWRASRARPILLDAETLTIRTGVRWTIAVPRAAIAGVDRRAPSTCAAQRAAGVVEKPLRAALLGAVNVWIELAEPVIAAGPYGRERRATRLALWIDEPGRFVDELTRAPAGEGRS